MVEKITEILKDISIDASSAFDAADEFEVETTFEAGQAAIDLLTEIQGAAAEAIRAIVDKMGK